MDHTHETGCDEYGGQCSTGCEEQDCYGYFTLDVAPDGSVWLSGGSVAAYDGETWTQYPEAGCVLGFGPDGVVWAEASNNGRASRHPSLRTTGSRSPSPSSSCPPRSRRTPLGSLPQRGVGDPPAARRAPSGGAPGRGWLIGSRVPAARSARPRPGRHRAGEPPTGAGSQTGSQQDGHHGTPWVSSAGVSHQIERGWHVTGHPETPRCRFRKQQVLGSNPSVGSTSPA